MQDHEASESERAELEVSIYGTAGYLLAEVYDSAGRVVWRCLHGHRMRKTALDCGKRWIRREQASKCQHDCHYYSLDGRGTCCSECWRGA